MYSNVGKRAKEIVSAEVKSCEISMVRVRSNSGGTHFPRLFNLHVDALIDELSSPRVR